MMLIHFLYSLLFCWWYFEQRFVLVVGKWGKMLDDCLALRMGSRVSWCRGSTSHGLRWAACQETLCFRRLMPNWYRLNESCLCDRVCELGAGRACRNWNGQALCGGVHREGIYGNTRKRGRVGTTKERWQWVWGMWKGIWCDSGSTGTSWERKSRDNRKMSLMCNHDVLVDVKFGTLRL